MVEEVYSPAALPPWTSPRVFSGNADQIPEVAVSVSQVYRSQFPKRASLNPRQVNDQMPPF
jgi:hypothetical protein